MQGVGTATKSYEPLTAEQEIFLWDKGVFSIHSAKGLINAVFWYNCKCFGLKGGDEHRTLVLEQYFVGLDSVSRFLQFNGRLCKNVQGGLKQKNVQTKNLKVYSNPDLGEHCVIGLFSTYMALIPQPGPFYRRPIKGSCDPPHFPMQVLGKNSGDNSISAKKQDLWARTPTTVGRLPVPQPFSKKTQMNS